MRTKSPAARLHQVLIGESAPMKALYRQISLAANCDFTVLISGETGTGKEIVARTIHLQSSRARRPFVSLNCGTLSETLWESELFGYERGASTGAARNKKGLFEAAHGGTIALDCISELSTPCQVKLLRVLQTSAGTPADLRFIAATNCDLVREMEAGRFREDLYYRIAVLPISTPPLRECPSDIPLLVDHFLRDAQERLAHSGDHMFELAAITALASYTWPGNVRQLKNVVERLVATSSDGVTITEHDIYTTLAAATLTNAKAEILIHENDSLDAILDRAMLRVYDQLIVKTGSHTQVAKMLKTDRVSLYQRIKRARQRLLLTKSC